MDKLFAALEQVSLSERELPFSLYSSVSEQRLLNVPIAKPLLVVVIRGNKELGQDAAISVPTGGFAFLSDSPAVNMRNIPSNREYLALLLEFDDEDFVGHANGNGVAPDYLVGTVNLALERCLQQFVESVAWAPESIWRSRKQEILSLLHHLGYKDVFAMSRKPQLSQRLHDLFAQTGYSDLSLTQACARLAVSESTLRRKLKREGTSVQEVKDRARLGFALHLLQTSNDSISRVAERCGYRSASRFTDRFKQHFGLTPSELRKTRLNE